ncbi:MAG: AI-2E family transporter [Marmoricola sp.]
MPEPGPDLAEDQEPSDDASPLAADPVAPPDSGSTPEPDQATDDASSVPERVPAKLVSTRLRAPFRTGFMIAAGALLAYWFGGLIVQAGSVIILIVLALFIAFGLNPVVMWLHRHGVRRSLAVTLVALGFVAALALFALAIVPLIVDQATALADNAPGWFDQLSSNRQVQRWDDKYAIVEKAKNFFLGGDLTKRLFGGVVGIGLAILSTLANAFVVIVLTLYFLASLDSVKEGLYNLAPASGRARVHYLGDRIIAGIGGYVSGAFVVALAAGLSTLIFLFIIGLGQYAVALATVVALLDVIPMIGATLGAVVVSAIGLATDVHTGIICIVFYVIYQQVENYVIYPRVMSKSVNVPGAVTVIAAVVGASLLGVIGALLAIPVAAAILLLVREVFVAKQDTR